VAEEQTALEFVVKLELLFCDSCWYLICTALQFYIALFRVVRSINTQR